MIRLETRQETPNLILLGQSQDLLHHARLQQQFDAVLGRRYDPEDLLHRSYNPVTDRWNIERLRARGDRNGEEKSTKEIRANLEKNLRERLKVVESVIRYRIEGGYLYSELFPNEPFSDVLARGAEIRLRYGTSEPEREGWLGEQAGWEKIHEEFTDPNAKVSKTKTTFSPPGVAEDSAYRGKYVDKYELVEDNGKKYVRLTRTGVDFDYIDYEKEAFKLNPNYFDDYDGRPLDAWYLSHPLDGEVADVRAKGMPLEEFMEIYNDPILQAFIDYYVTRIKDDVINWRQVASAFNAILNYADEKNKQGLKGENIYLSESFIREKIEEMGRRTPKPVMGGGCPTNKGFENSVSMFAGDDEDYEINEIGRCIVCGKEPTLVGPCKICFDCDPKKNKGQMAA